MVELTRRFFLGGAIVLIAAKTFVPSVNAMKNLPTIYGNGIDDDTPGLSALFRNDPCTFNKEQIGVEEHQGIIFYNGRFMVKNTIEIPKKTSIRMYKAWFVGTELEPDAPFFMSADGSGNQLIGNGLIFELNDGAPNKLIKYAYIEADKKNDKVRKYRDF